MNKIAIDAEKRLMGGVVVVHFFGGSHSNSLVFKERSSAQCLWCLRFISVADIRADREHWVEDPNFPDKAIDVVRCVERADAHY